MRSLKIATLLLGILAGCFLVPRVVFPGYSAQELYALAEPNVAVIEVVRDGGTGHGTAFYVGHGYWVSAAHVAAAKSTFRIHGKPAIVVNLDAVHDVAIFVSPGTGPGLPLCGRIPAVGDPATSVGFPLSLVGRPTLSMGTVSSFADLSGSHRGDNDIVTLMSIFPGNSGGPVFSDRGCVIGIARYVVIDASSGLPQLAYTLSGLARIEYARAMLNQLGYTD